MQQDIEKRLEILEHKVESLEQLPDRVSAVESQIVQLRVEMRDGFSALRSEIGAVDSGLRAEIKAGDEETRALIKTSEEETRALIKASEEETRALIKAGDDETHRYMRVLHEDVIERIKWLGERWNG